MREILEMKTKTASSSVVDKLFNEWQIINEKVRVKIEIMEKFRSYSLRTDSKLNALSAELYAWETFLRHDCCSRVDLTQYDQVAAKRQ